MSETKAKPIDHQTAIHEHYDPVGHKIGMWLFLFTELMLFGALFIMYAVYLFEYKVDFMHGSGLIQEGWGLALGTTNTIILLTSSLAVALSIATLKRGKVRLCQGLLFFTLLCAAAFLVIKFFEWSHKIEIGMYPSGPALQGLFSEPSILDSQPKGLQLFIGLYFTMTAIHALHIIIGAIFIITTMVYIQRGVTNKDRVDLLDNAGLYWHLVDLIWIYLFPLYYLIGEWHPAASH
jgi:cytochrome c oxidase subunit 3